jgi:arylsulfatase A-like enzyme
MSEKPNVIYILSDEHFGGATSYGGDANVRTPVMDRLASEGRAFERAYANCPICTPSRGTIFSGRHAHSGPVQFFFDVYKATAPSTATILRNEGYHTAYFGKWHCGTVRDQVSPGSKKSEKRIKHPHRTPEYHRAGFQDWFGFELNNDPFQGTYTHQNETELRSMNGEYQTDFLTDRSLEYMENYDKDDPLFMVLSVEPPHFPLEAPEKYMRFKPEELELRPNVPESHTERCREELATYYAMIENLDDNMGRVLDTIERLPRFKDNTLVVYISDHGEFLYSHGSECGKENPHEESVRIPAIFWQPGRIEGGELLKPLFSLVDLLPTTLSLLDIRIPGHVQGEDFSPALLGEDFKGPDSVLLEMAGNPRWNLDFLDWRGFVTHRWKYAFYETGHELLFDLKNDPYEMNNLAEHHPEQINEMRNALLELLEATKDPYFDVLIQYGTPLEGPTLDVSGNPHTGVAPVWKDSIKKM